jgi:DNA-binding transcriptional LysR family regulator
MDFAALQAFLEVARTGSFSAAAATLYLTQPAVSKRIAALESELAVALFDRVGRKVALTEAGRLLLPRARQLVNEAADLKRLVTDLSGEIAGPLVMATSHHVGLRRLPAVIRTYVRAHPRVELDIRFMDSEAACRAVLSGEVQLAVVTLPPDGEPGSLSLTPVWHDPLAFMAAPDHPICRLESLDLVSLSAYPAILPGPATYTRQILDDAMQRVDAKVRVSMSTNYLETLKMLVAAGLGWSLLPESMVDGSVTALDVAGPALSRELGIVTHRRRSPSNAERAMIEACLASAR